MGSRRCNCTKNKLKDLEKRLAGRSGLSVALESTVTFINLLSAIGGNLLVCWTIFKHPRLRSTSNIFISCLTLSDVLIAVLGFPFTLAVLVEDVGSLTKPRAIFKDLLSGCSVHFLF